MEKPHVWWWDETMMNFFLIVITLARFIPSDIALAIYKQIIIFASVESLSYGWEMRFSLKKNRDWTECEKSSERDRVLMLKNLLHFFWDSKKEKRGKIDWETMKMKNKVFFTLFLLSSSNFLLRNLHFFFNLAAAHVQLSDSISPSTFSPLISIINELEQYEKWSWRCENVRNRKCSREAKKKNWARFAAPAAPTLQTQIYTQQLLSLTHQFLSYMCCCYDKHTISGQGADTQCRQCETPFMSTTHRLVIPSTSFLIFTLFAAWSIITSKIKSDSEQSTTTRRNEISLERSAATVQAL